MIMQEFEGLEGIRVGGLNITSIIYADDTLLFADSETKRQYLLNTLVIESQSEELKVIFFKNELHVRKD